MATIVTKLCVLCEVCALSEEMVLQLRWDMLGNCGVLADAVKKRQLCFEHIIQKSTTAWWCLEG
jgi:hypothetical protein